MSETKRCRQCGKTKPLDGFYAKGGYTCRVCHGENVKRNRAKDPDRWKEYRRLWAEKNREKNVGYSQAYKRRHPDRVKDQWYRSQYGIGLAEYEARFADQLGRCAACREVPPPDALTPSQRMLNVDHDHGTGEVRGLLCSRCNRILGFAEDKTAVLLALVAYLDRGPVWSNVTTEVS